MSRSRRMKSLLSLSLLCLSACTVPRLGSVSLTVPPVRDPATGAITAGITWTPPGSTPAPAAGVVDYTDPKAPVDVDASLYSTPEPGDYYEG